jgi:Rad3-related DNA helicase
VGRFSGAPFVVIDEADNLENTLINFTTLTFTPYALRRMDMLDLSATLKMTSKFKDQLLESWKDFGRQASYRVKAIIKKMSEDIEGWGQNLNDSQTKVIKERVRVVRLLEKIDLFLRNVDQDWILDIQEGKLIFRPLWMTPELANEYLWDHGNKFVLMSASFYPRNILAKCLGLDIDDMDYHIVPSQFPISNRPIYIHPVANMTAKTVDVELPKLVPVIKQIADSRPNVKILIHAVSYNLANKIFNALNNPRVVIHNGANKQEVIDDFKASDKPLILISPSCERGISLEEDLCRVIIIAKCPFLSLVDRVVSSRIYSSHIGQAWYGCTAALTILQQAGRGVRSKDDYAETFILDQQAKNLIVKNPGWLPEWFLDAMVFELPNNITLDKIHSSI